jgi:hypothetical protein
VTTSKTRRAAAEPGRCDTCKSEPYACVAWACSASRRRPTRIADA